MFVGWAIFSGSDSSSTSSSNDSHRSGTVTGGQYRCSSYDSSQADSLSPTENKSKLSNEQASLNQRSAELDTLKSRIEGDHVTDDSPQYAMDEHNRMIDEYDTKIASYESDSLSFQPRIDRFNAQVKARNNYLMAHCTKAP